MGHCRANTTCNHVTGLCDGGCGAGWIGYKCDESKAQSNNMLSVFFFRRGVLLIYCNIFIIIRFLSENNWQNVEKY